MLGTTFMYILFFTWKPSQYYTFLKLWHFKNMNKKKTFIYQNYALKTEIKYLIENVLKVFSSMCNILPFDNVPQSYT